MPDGSEETVRSDSPEADRLTGLGGQRVAITAAPVPDLLTDPELMGRYGRNETTPSETAAVDAAIAESMRSTVDPMTGQIIRPLITPLVSQSAEARRAAGGQTALPEVTLMPISDEALSRDIRLGQIGGEAFGTSAFFQNLANLGVSIFEGNAPYPEMQQARKDVQALSEDAKMVLRELTPGRAEEIVRNFTAILPAVSSVFESPDVAADTVQSVVDFFNSQIDSARNTLRLPLSAQERDRINQAVIRAEAIRNSYNALAQGISGVTGQPVQTGDSGPRTSLTYDEIMTNPDYILND
jgi:hypothetical protein